MEKYSKNNFKSILIWLSLLLFFIPHSNGCFSRNSPYRGFGLCLDVWEWRCPYQKKCIEAWQVCDGWVDCISGKDEVPNHTSISFKMQLNHTRKKYMYTNIYNIKFYFRVVRHAGKKMRWRVNMKNGDGWSWKHIFSVSYRDKERIKMTIREKNICIRNPRLFQIVVKMIGNISCNNYELSSTWRQCVHSMKWKLHSILDLYLPDLVEKL